MLAPYTMDLLKSHLQNELLKRKSLKITKNLEDSYVFTNDEYNHIGTNTYLSWYKRFCKRQNLRYIPQYGLRHTSATLLAFNNIPIPNIAEHHGHKNLKTTEIYLHAVEEVRQDMKNIMNENLMPKLDVTKLTDFN